MISSDKQQPILADSGNRAVALLLDLILLAFLIGTFAGYLDAIRQVLVPLLFLVYFAAMPLTRLQGTLGKWICRIKICDGQGSRLGWRASLIRAMVTIGWFALPLMVGEFLTNAAYPDGGGYRLLANGNVVITFSVLPELRGRSITFVPKLAGSGQIDWQCNADPEIERRYLPSSCR